MQERKSRPRSGSLAFSERDQKLAHCLLVELLAHQFCFPVEWIETQNLVLGSRKTERVVEIGPSTTLVNMAKRTINLKYGSRDTAQNVSRRLLAFQRDLDKICYEEKPVAVPVEEPPTLQAPVVEQLAPIPIAPESLVAAPAQQAVAEVEDSPASAMEIATTIIATGMKKPLDELQMSKSIKTLSGGRSTLQNEIIGDLAAEFNSIPDGAEDLPISALCASLQATFPGKPNQKSLSLIDKMISSKSPGAFQITGIRKYLKSRWGLGVGRQVSVLLRAVTVQPDFRLKTEDETKIFLDGVVQAYVNKMGIKLPTAPTGASSGNGSSATVDPRALDFLEEKQRSVMEHQIHLYAEQLGISLEASDKVVTSLQERITELQGQIDLWNIEHGEVYASGIKPLFSSLKARTYDSWWNWAIQDLLILAHRIRMGSMALHDAEFEDLKFRLLNRSHPRLIDTMRYILSQTGNTVLRQALEELVPNCERSSHTPPTVVRNPVSMAPVTTIDEDGRVTYSERPRPSVGSGGLNEDSCLRLGRKSLGAWHYDETMSRTLLKVLARASSSGFTFEGKTVLLTGAGQGSIGAEMLHGFLAGGAQVIVTSSSYSPKVTKYYQDLYAHYGARGSRLVLLPFNQASQQDVEALVSYIYGKDGLSWDLDFVVPFAAIPEAGRELDNIDSKSELAHRLMLTNLLRLLGAIKKQKFSRSITSRPAQVVLPMSPNHGTFGNDGLYAESKLGLESLFEKWHSENWGDYLTLCGAIIGWTRGTALMADNDIISEGMEKLGMRTYSRHEMAFNILSLMSPSILQLSMSEPVLADLSGGMGLVSQLKEMTNRIRQGIAQTIEERQAIAKEAALEKPTARLGAASIEQHANVEFNFPHLPDYDREIQPLSKTLQGMVDLDRVVVITGFGEIGPYGNARTRWRMESDGQLSHEGCIELAWIMGLIKHHSGYIHGQPYAGWLDMATGKPVSDEDIKKKYEEHMLKHSGIRLMESRMADSAWDSREALYEIELERDQEPFETSEKVAQELKKAHGDNIVISEIPETSQFKITMKKGARIMVPKLSSTQHTVGGQIPKGWNARTYGVPEDVINQVDPATLYPLVCAAEALQSAGIFDPYELYRYIHVSELGICVGSGLGGSTSSRKMYRDRYQDRPAANDVLAESFINSGPAWINMLLLSAAGPNKTPVGACATAIESMDSGYDLITSGKARACLVGGYDDMSKDVADEFANIKATVNSTEDLARGRDPREMSRPATSTRGGFVEAEGAGIQLITSASLALEMGLPIHGIVALTQTASDKAGRSLPAPGRGIIGSAAQSRTTFDPPLMNMAYRKRNLQMRRSQIQETKESQLMYLEEELNALVSEDNSCGTAEYRKHRIHEIDADARRQEREALNLYGNHFWRHDTRIAPIRGALAVWGLTIDDLDVASFHGTSTKANERNECEVINEQLTYLRRRKGNVIPGVFQKYLTGHPKGAAGAWMLNGCLQMLNTGLIPGNRNADNIEDYLRKFEFIVFPNKNIQTDGIKAFSVTSFGFGQKSAQLIGVHPKYLFATLKEEAFRTYQEKVLVRQKRAFRKFHEGMANNSLFVAKEEAPYAAGEEMEYLLNPEARLSASAPNSPAGHTPAE